MVNAKRYAELTGIPAEQQKRLYNLFNYARQQKLISSLNEIKKEKTINYNNQENYIKGLEAQKEPNKILIHKNKKELVIKQMELEDIKKEIADAQKYTVKDK